MPTTIDQAYEMAGLLPYGEFARQAVYRNAASTRKSNPFDPKSEIYRQIGSTTYMCVQWLLRAPEKTFIKARTKDQAQQIGQMMQQLAVKLHGYEIEMKGGNLQARVPAGYEVFDERKAQENLVVSLWWAGLGA